MADSAIPPTATADLRTERQELGPVLLCPLGCSKIGSQYLCGREPGNGRQSAGTRRAVSRARPERLLGADLNEPDPARLGAPGHSLAAVDACASPRRWIWRKVNSARLSPVLKTAVSFSVTFLPLAKPAMVK